VEVAWNGSAVTAGRIVACRSLAGPIEVTASDNRLGFQHGLVSFDGYCDVNAWRQALRWKSRNNRYDAAGPWLRLEGRPGPAWNELTWEQLWAAR
jgi:hypothetical protein